MDQKKYEKLPLTTETFDDRVVIDDCFCHLEDLEEELCAQVRANLFNLGEEEIATEEDVRDALETCRVFPCKEYRFTIPEVLTDVDVLEEAMTPDFVDIDWEGDPPELWREPGLSGLVEQKLEELRALLEPVLSTNYYIVDQTRRYDFSALIPEIVNRFVKGRKEGENESTKEIQAG
jgi:hypothetical protein